MIERWSSSTACLVTHNHQRSFLIDVVPKEVISSGLILCFPIIAVFISPTLTWPLIAGALTCEPPRHLIRWTSRNCPWSSEELISWWAITVYIFSGCYLCGLYVSQAQKLEYHTPESPRSLWALDTISNVQISPCEIASFRGLYFFSLYPAGRPATRLPQGDSSLSWCFAFSSKIIDTNLVRPFLAAASAPDQINFGLLIRTLNPLGNGFVLNPE